MKLYFGLLLGLLLGYALSTGAEVMNCDWNGHCTPSQPPAGWAPYTQSQQQQLNWQLQQNFNNALQQQRPC